MRLILTSFLLLCSIIPALLAQNPEWINLTPSTQNVITENKGYIWVGGIGLSSIDKVSGEIRSYNTINSPLPYNEIRDIAIDSDDNKWIGTWSGGLAKFDGNNWTLYNKNNSGLASNFINALEFDMNGNLWIGTDGAGLTKFDGNVWTTYNTHNSGLPSNTISVLESDKNGYIWIGTPKNGLASFNGGQWRLYDTNNSGLKSNKVVEIIADSIGNIWTATELGGVARFDGNVWTDFDAGMDKRFINAMAVINENDIWISNHFGLECWDGQKWTNLQSQYGIYIGETQSIYIDSDNIKWLGTYPSSVVKYIDYSNFERFDVYNTGLYGDDIYIVGLDKDNSVWIGATFCGLCHTDIRKWYRYNPDEGNFPGWSVYDIQFDQNGQIWIASSAGLTSRQNDQWTTFSKENSGLTDNNLGALEIDDDGVFWIGCGYDLFRYDGSTWDNLSEGLSFLPDSPISSISIDNTGKKWIGTRSGLLTYDTNWCIYNLSNSGLPDTTILITLFDKEGSLWLGTRDGGLVKYNGTDWISYNMQNSGLQSNSVYSMCFDEDNKIWVGTENGLHLFDGESWKNLDFPDCPVRGYWITDIDIDKYNNKWISVYGGVYIYREGGVSDEVIVSILDHRKQLIDRDISFYTYPNPATESFVLHYTLTDVSDVSISLIDLLGNEILKLNKGQLEAGIHTEKIDTANMNQGTYIVNLTVDGKQYQIKEMLIR
jgi:ligand-binding sensor domain-containing protein